MFSQRRMFHMLCALAFLICPVLLHADSIQYLSSSGTAAGGVYVYPYNFSVNDNGSTTTTTLACLDYNREITQNELWQVNIHGLDMGMSQTAIDYRADAVLFYLFGQYGLSNSDVQYAIWSIFDPAVTSNTYFTGTSQYLVNVAMAYAVDPTTMNSGFFQNFSLFTPTSDQTGWTMGEPQEFIGAAMPSTAVTPEPSSVVLLGTGLLCAVVFWRRRDLSLTNMA